MPSAAPRRRRPSGRGDRGRPREALRWAADRLEVEAGELASLICREVGKPIAEARGEVARSAAILRFHAAAALDPEGASFPAGRRPLAAVHPPGAARRRRPDHPLELPAGDPAVEARPGAGLRQRPA
jgi:aldehyde dehydrogenase (NAD+)